MPGHLLGAISVIPELSCDGKTVKVRKEWGVEDTIACVGKTKFMSLSKTLSVN